jgi:hypothetical protein
MMEGASSDWSFSISTPNTDSVLSEPGNLQISQWQHLAGTYDGVNMTIYRNGVLVASKPHPYPGNVHDANFVLLGGWPRPLNGLIDEVRIWNIVRTQSEIQATMNYTLSGNEPGLVGYWHLDEGSGQVAFDSTNNHQDGRLGSSLASDSKDPVWVISDAPIQTPTYTPTPTATPTPCYDFDGDGQVDVNDIQAVAIRWRLTAANPDPDNNPATPNYETRFDLDGDGDIDIVDIMLVSARWGERCP